MTVKDFIKELQELDPDRNIYILYDGCIAFEPTIGGTFDAEDESYHKEHRVTPALKEGDYYIPAS